MENILNQTRFALFNDYQIFSDERKIKGKYINKEDYLDNTLEVRSHSKIIFTYDPLIEGKGLFTELAKLHTIWDIDFDINKVLYFFRKFGLPMGLDLSPYRFERVAILKMCFSDFFYELAHYKEIFNTWIALKTNDSSKIKKVSLEYEQLFNTHFKETLQPLSDRDKALYIFANKFNEKSKGNHTFTYSNGNPKIIRTFSNLFEVAYFQLSQFIQMNGDFKTCKNCEELFPSLHESSLFCLPLPLNDVSNCMNAYKQRKNRDKKKALSLYKEGQCSKDILQTINKNRRGNSKRTLQEINEWIRE